MNYNQLGKPGIKGIPRQPPSKVQITKPMEQPAPNLAQLGPPPTVARHEYWLDGDGIDREVLQAEICNWLGNDAISRPGVDANNKPGYWIKALRPFTEEMIRSLKALSANYIREKKEYAEKVARLTATEREKALPFKYGDPVERDNPNKRRFAPYPPHPLREPARESIRAPPNVRFREDMSHPDEMDLDPRYAALPPPLPGVGNMYVDDSYDRRFRPAPPASYPYGGPVPIQQSMYGMPQDRSDRDRPPTRTVQYLPIPSNVEFMPGEYGVYHQTDRDDLVDYIRCDTKSDYDRYISGREVPRQVHYTPAAPRPSFGLPPARYDDPYMQDELPPRDPRDYRQPPPRDYRDPRDSREYRTPRR